LALFQRLKVIAVALTTSVGETSAATGFFVVVPAWNSSSTRADHSRLVTNVFTSVFTVLFGQEVVFVSTAASVKEAHTLVRGAVIVPTRFASSARTNVFGKQTMLVFSVNRQTIHY